MPLFGPQSYEHNEFKMLPLQHYAVIDIIIIQNLTPSGHTLKESLEAQLPEPNIEICSWHPTPATVNADFSRWV